jgi:hypothetical protein
MAKMRLRDKVAVVVLSVVHLGVVLWHGDAHTALAVGLSQGETAFVVLVIFMAPLVAASFVWTRHVLVGGWMFFLSMLGALVFGVYHHYVMISPDNVAHLPQGNAGAHFAFVTSAGALALLELISAVYGAFCLGSLYGTRAMSHGAREA